MDADGIIRAVSHLVTTSHDGERVKAAKQILVKVWGLLDPRDRYAFVAQCDLETWDFKPVNSKRSKAERQDQDLAAALRDWRRVLGSELDEKQREIALGVMKRLADPDWCPSPKMREFIVSLHHQTCGTDPDVLEEG